VRARKELYKGVGLWLDVLHSGGVQNANSRVIMWRDKLELNMHEGASCSLRGGGHLIPRVSSSRGVLCHQT